MAKTDETKKHLAVYLNFAMNFAKDNFLSTGETRTLVEHNLIVQ